MFSRNRLIALTILVVAFTLTACGGGKPSSSNGQSTMPAVSNGEGGGEGGVEAALVTYTDSSQGFSIGHPGTWTQDPAFTPGVKFVGGDSVMTLEFVTPPTGSDGLTYAQSDIATVTAAFPGFKQLSLAASTEVRDAVVLGFTANGISAVTGKTFTAHNERYYISLSDGRIAVLTVAGPENIYDREGIRDIALTFKIK